MTVAFATVCVVCLSAPATTSLPWSQTHAQYKNPLPVCVRCLRLRSDPRNDRVPLRDCVDPAGPPRERRGQ